VSYLTVSEQRDQAQHHAIGAGDYDNFIVDETGALLCCGCEGLRTSGFLGLGDLFGGSDGAELAAYTDNSMEQINQPRRMPCEQGVRMRGVATGDAHSLAVSEEGLVYLWGSHSDKASMLVSDQEPRRVPTVVEPLRGARMRMVAAGVAHSVALSEEGLVYTWGDADATRSVNGRHAV
jgi:alpha-tubulin suppressor-like RCC1 family protein